MIEANRASALYRRCKDERFTRLHLDHVPVIDEDHQRVDYKAIISEALTLGYDSVMVDGSRLELADNIEATQEVTVLAHEAGVPIEAELGAVLGHEQGPLPPYEELFASGKGFTDVDEAVTFARETNIDWLSVAVGNIHGAVSAAKKNEKKITARIDIDHLDAIHRAVGIPLVLHGGSGIATTFIREAIRHGITKINVGTAVRQPYEQLRETSVARAQEAVYATVTQVLNDELDIAGSADLISSAQ